ncbi:hypothetical protein OF846_001199 [Rhodotorula toruloides]|nr:hypothetical protein OF846_001199 [Rhodotorula toruloides]
MPDLGVSRNWKYSYCGNESSQRLRRGEGTAFLRVGVVEGDEEEGEGRGSGGAAIRVEVDAGEELHDELVRDAQLSLVRLVVHVPTKRHSAKAKAYVVRNPSAPYTRRTAFAERMWGGEEEENAPDFAADRNLSFIMILPRNTPSTSTPARREPWSASCYQRGR